VKIFLTELNYSTLLPKAKSTNLKQINKSMAQYEGVTVIPKFDEKMFKTCPNDTSWSEDTANAMLSHWLSYLN
jgi:hypothetical protein